MIDTVGLTALSEQAGLGPAAIYLQSLSTDERAELEPGTPIYPASMIKTPLAVAVAARCSLDRLDPAETVAVTPENMTVNDAPSPLLVGAVASIAELVELMVCRSDNVATNLLIDRVGRAQATADLAGLGFSTTAIRRKLSGALPLIADPAATGRNVHPARDAARLFEHIARAKVPGAAWIEGLLAAQFWNAKLSAGLEPGDHFAHKTGDTDEVSHDGGILTLATGERYVLVVYTQLASTAATDARFAAFMRALRPGLVAAIR